MKLKILLIATTIRALEEKKRKEQEAKLLEYKNKVCKNTMYGDVKCDFARDVVFKKREEKEVGNYFAHKDLLKKDFNECYHKIDSLNKKNKYKESQKVQKSYKCYMAKKGALKLNIYGYFQPMK